MNKPLPTLPTTSNFHQEEGVGSFKYRNWTLGEHQDTLFKKGSDAQVHEILEQVLENCLTEVLDSKGRPYKSVKDIPLVLAELAFIKIRSVSVDDEQEYIVKCLNEDCSYEDLVAKVDFKNTEVVRLDDFKETITIGGYSIELKLPTISFLSLKPEEIDPQNIEFIANNIESISTEEEYWDFKDYSLEERSAFVRSLNPSFPITFIKRYSKLPQISSELLGTCPECGKEYKKEVKGIASLFIG